MCILNLHYHFKPPFPSANSSLCRPLRVSADREGQLTTDSLSSHRRTLEQLIFLFTITFPAHFTYYGDGERWGMLFADVLVIIVDTREDGQARVV